MAPHSTNTSLKVPSGALLVATNGDHVPQVQAGFTWKDILHESQIEPPQDAYMVSV